MNIITEQDYKKALEQDVYYKDRWGYYKTVIGYLNEIEFNNVLEVGCKRLPIVKDGHAMDINSVEGVKLTFNYDATNTPYEFIKTNQYDLLIGLQVLEHLHPHQKKVFKEWSRIAKNIVISLPYMWHCPKDVMHHNITIPKIYSWTGMKPNSIKIVDARIILKYETHNCNT